LELPYDFIELKDAPPVIFNVFDKDKGLFSDSADFLGRATIFLNNAYVSQDDSIPVPRWHPIKYGVSETSPECGQVLCSFSVVPDDFIYREDITQVNLNQLVNVAEYKVRINVLGLRKLESTGLLPV